MRRLALAVLMLILSAVLVPSAASAKGISKLEACGAAGCRDATPAGHDAGVLEGGPQIAAPARPAPYFALNVVIGAPDMPEADAKLQILYVPSQHAMRVGGANREPQWMQPTAHAENALKRAIAHLVPFDAATLDRTAVRPAVQARVVEVVPAPRPDDPSSGGSWALWAGGAALLALLGAGAGWALRHRRRAGPDPHPAA